MAGLAATIERNSEHPVLATIPQLREVITAQQAVIMSNPNGITQEEESYAFSSISLAREGITTIKNGGQVWW